MAWAGTKQVSSSISAPPPDSDFALSLEVWTYADVALEVVAVKRGHLLYEHADRFLIPASFRQLLQGEQFRHLLAQGISLLLRMGCILLTHQPTNELEVLGYHIRQLHPARLAHKDG
eukprot:1953204-Amphidinium_carterae.1